MGKDELEIPEGHKVSVIRPSPRPFLERAESGTWILNFGDGKDLTHALDAVEAFVARSHRETVIWLFQGEFLAALHDVDGFLVRIRAIVTASHDKVEHLAVFAKEAGLHTEVMASLKQIGLAVFYSAPDGACFVEVHRPDGIVVGLPGRPYDVATV
jgi:hypothetical protein